MIVTMSHIQPLNYLLPLLLLTSIATGAAAQTQSRPGSGGATPVELGKFATWTAYALQAAQGRECYIVSMPQASEPKDIQPGTARRNATMMFIAHRPAQNVRNELFVNIGYGFKDKANANAEVIGQNGTRRFQLFTKEQGAWLLNAAEESQFVDLARKGREIKVRGTSQRGTSTTDTYALAGLSGALDRIGQECK